MDGSNWCDKHKEPRPCDWCDLELRCMRETCRHRWMDVRSISDPVRYMCERCGLAVEAYPEGVAD